MFFNEDICGEIILEIMPYIHHELYHFTFYPVTKADSSWGFG